MREAYHQTPPEDATTIREMSSEQFGEQAIKILSDLEVLFKKYDPLETLDLVSKLSEENKFNEFLDQFSNELGDFIEKFKKSDFYQKSNEARRFYGGPYAPQHKEFENITEFHTYLKESLDYIRRLINSTYEASKKNAMKDAVKDAADLLPFFDKMAAALRYYLEEEDDLKSDDSDDQGTEGNEDDL
jgi:hypothetical protein